ncbi:helix-turn-helix transcriptional regulator [Thioalkalivibrio thiocyanodenitrificans]|uniref:helix-turn-helix transcriptional regulator n=1 Tax=Thioalkalivibrio thiocyanodenitrificans TaxID=243063 RepID=UPI0018DB9C47|nr:helix-turn-helix domain-containing protein [Thioalkalivibrio thiocyanodenitrificans]
MHETDLITRHEAAEILRVSLRTLDALIERGRVPRPISLGGRRLYFHREQLDAWIRNQFGLADPTGLSEQPPAEKRRRGRPRKASTDTGDNG